jgi:threonine dehydratase
VTALGDTTGPVPAAARLVTRRELDAARERIAALCVRTPVVQVSHPADGAPVWVKAESLQRSGSFKLRGAANALAALAGGRRVRGVVTFSAGNHGRALAWAARRAGVAATVVMPETAPAAKIEATRALGAAVVIQPLDDFVGHAQQLAEAEGLLLVPPYDDPFVIAGQGTVGLEVLDQVAQVDVVVVPVGGGGLVSGVAAAVKAERPDALVVAVEPELAGDLAEGFALGRRTVWSRALTRRTIADGLRSAAVGELAWAHIQAFVDEVVTVTEDSIVAATRWLADSGKLVVEPSGAVAAAALLERPDLVRGSVVAVASGGNVDLATFAALVADGQAAASTRPANRAR